MNLVVLDGYTLNPGDLSWDKLQELATCVIYDRTAPGEIIDRCREADIVLLNKVPFSAGTIAALPQLKFINVMATGFNIVDIDAAAKRKIPVANVPAYSTNSVAQLVFAHILNFTHRVAHHAHNTAYGRWSANKDFSYWDYPLIELAGQTLGILGFGKIGRTVATIASAFGMNIIYYDITGPQEDLPGIRRVYTLEELFQQSDILSLHCPLTKDTEKIVNKEHLHLMKKTALLINTSRGQLIDEDALAEALMSGRIAGVGLDVLCQEPPAFENMLLSARNCYITPHFAWATTAARQRLMDAITGNVRAFLAGKPQNVVNSW
ncbi:MAG TPA: D-2-hydroxyacid dehydrogenase [bacterium]|nr:D-2-hydroxyacid dehydrogenase [bacterium]HPN45977.1 D-2-hydroxyacid dehydrogenase [bacterium]